MANNDQSIVIKKVKKGGHGHHGGAWKIAYADFVTAMMAFFLLMWLLAMATPEQKKALAEYFAPPNISESTSGAGGVMGGTEMQTEGAKMMGAASETTMNVANQPQTTDQFGFNDPARGQQAGKTPVDGTSPTSSPTQLNSSFDQQFHSAATSIRQAWRAMPDITKIADNLLVEETPEGLNIQIMDQAGRPMFPEGSKYPYELTRKAIAVIAPILQQLPNQITISGHTAAGGKYPNPNYGAWELSSDRANVVRSILGEFGLSNDHVQQVSGQATAEPFFPNDPYLAANERVKIVVLHEPPPVPPDLGP